MYDIHSRKTNLVIFFILFYYSYRIKFRKGEPLWFFIAWYITVFWCADYEYDNENWQSHFQSLWQGQIKTWKMIFSLFLCVSRASLSRGEMGWNRFAWKSCLPKQGRGKVGVASRGSRVLLSKRRCGVRVASHGSHALLSRRGKWGGSCFVCK